MATHVTLRLPCRVHYRPAMTFRQIAQALETTENCVKIDYLRAMRKIARRPYSLAQLAQAVAESESRRQVGISRICPQAE